MFREEKRLVSMLLCIALLLSMMPMAVFAQGNASISFKIQASATQVAIGDIVDFTVYATGTNITALEFKLDIPQGLTYVAGSAAVPSGLRNDLGWAATDWTEGSMKWTGYNDLPADFAKDTVVLTFSCVADEAGTYEVNLKNPLPFDGSWQKFRVDDIAVDLITVVGEDAPEEPTIPDHPSSGDEPEEPTIPDRPSSGDEPEEPTIPDRPSSGDEPEEPTVPEVPFFRATVEASVTEAQAGDVINFTVYGYGKDITALEFKPDIPQGLTYVAGSAAVPSGLRNDLGWAATDWTEESMKWTGYNDLPADFVKDAVVLTFSCVAEVAGTYEVNIKNLLPFNADWQQIAGESFGAQINVTPASEPCAHDYVGQITTAPSCTADGVITYTCSKCGESYNDTAPATDHSLTYVDATVTCTEAGNKAHYICACGKMFEDATGLIEIADAADLAIEALGHDFEEGTCIRCSMPELHPDSPFFWATVKASKTEAQVGDVIDYVVYGYGYPITTGEFQLSVPEGLRYVKNSAVCPADLTSYLGWAAADWTESSMMWSGYNDLPAFFEWNTVLLTFSCVVEKPGAYHIDLADMYISDADFEEVFPMVLVDTVIVPDRPSSDDEPEEPTVPEVSFFQATVEASVTEAQAGDVINFTVYGYGKDITSLEFKPDIPQGLTYVAGSAAIPSDLKFDLGWAATDWTEESMKWTGYNDLPADFAKDTVVLTFSCVAEVAGTYEVNVKNLLPFNADWQQIAGESFGAQINVTPAPEPCAHDYVGQITTAPSCTADGVITYTCSKCGERYNDTAPATGHTETAIPGTAADCTNTGLTDGVKCSVCGEILTAQEEIPALGHTKETIPGTAADCTNTGLTDGVKCAVCGEILTAQEEIPALGHNYEAVVTPPTVTEGGYTTHTCANCGDSYIDSYTEALGVTLTGNFKTFLNGEVTLELVQDGKTAYTATASGLEGSYELTGVMPGSYTLRVSKDLHVTREYEVTVEVNCAPVDVKLHRPGDLNGDGRVTVADVSKAYAHTKKATLLTDYEFLVCDVTGDGRISVADVSKLYAHSKKTTLLW